ncbi:MAG: hypothetical protein SGJ27_09710 [Candidatus Melainabacteria bacterium]|nr:hypothetical protein [Candidatus Melainabacteria bacterium]
MRTILILALVPLVLVICLAGLLITNPEIEYQIGQALRHSEGKGASDEFATFWLKQAADHGHAEAQALLGRSYLVGLPSQNLDQAVKYLTMGEKQNNNECIKLLSYANSYGQGVPQDYAKSIDLSRRSLAIEMDGRELMNLAFLTLILPAPLHDYTKSREYADELSRVGFSSAWAYWNLGIIYEYGLNCKKDYAKALQYYGSGARLGDNDCQYALARMLFEGKKPPISNAPATRLDKVLAHVVLSGKDAVPSDNSGRTPEYKWDQGKQTFAVDDSGNPRQYLETASATQVLDAQLLLGLILASEVRSQKTDATYKALLEQLAKRGFKDYAARLKAVSPPGKANNSKESIKLLTDESNDDDGSKQLVSAMCKRFGIGGKPDFKAFMDSLNLACSKNLVDAITIKANILTGMDTGQPYYDEAAKLYAVASEKGHAYAQGQFGMINALGFGVKHDWKPAIDWLEKSSKAGDPESQFMLGGFYCDGRGVAPDRKKALQLFESAAKQGHEDAALELGIICGASEFPDISPDQDKAEYWLRTAAGYGFQEANYYLGTQYMHNRKTEEAFKCFKDAADKGHLLSQLQVGKFHVNQENLEEARQSFSIALRQGSTAAKRELRLLDVRAAILGNNKNAKSLVVAKRKIDKGTLITTDMLDTLENKRTEDDTNWSNDILTDTNVVLGTTASEDIEEGSYITATELDIPEKNGKVQN